MTTATAQRPAERAIRNTDPVTCKRCLAIWKKRDRRKRNCGVEARRTPPASNPTPDGHPEEA